MESKFSLESLLKVVAQHPRLTHCRPNAKGWIKLLEEHFLVKEGKVIETKNPMSGEHYAYGYEAMTDRLTNLIYKHVFKVIKEDLEAEAVNNQIQFYVDKVK